MSRSWTILASWESARRAHRPCTYDMGSQHKSWRATATGTQFCHYSPRSVSVSSRCGRSVNSRRHIVSYRIVPDCSEVRVHHFHTMPCHLRATNRFTCSTNQFTCRVETRSLPTPPIYTSRLRASPTILRYGLCCRVRVDVILRHSQTWSSWLGWRLLFHFRPDNARPTFSRVLDWLCTSRNLNLFTNCTRSTLRVVH